MDNSDHNAYNLKFIRNILLILLCIVTFYLLNQMANLLVPLILASLFVLVLLPPIQWLIDHRVPRWIIVPIIAISTISLIGLMGTLIVNTVQDILKQQEYFFTQFEKKLISILAVLDTRLPIDLNFELFMEFIADSMNKENITGWAKNLALGVGSLSSSFIIFAVYFILLLMGVSNYRQYLKYVGGDKKALGETVEMLQKTISTYIGIKSIISLSTGILATVICLIFRIKFPIFWGLLTFILNYIPSLGSILATIPPVFMAFIQYENLGPVIVILILLITIQMVIGNFIDPMIMGDRLRLNTITVVFGLLFWGFIWGIPGMLISVPLMVIIKVILEKSETWSMVARVMSPSHNKTQEKGRKRKQRVIRRERAKRKDNRSK